MLMQTELHNIVKDVGLFCGGLWKKYVSYTGSSGILNLDYQWKTAIFGWGTFNLKGINYFDQFATISLLTKPKNVCQRRKLNLLYY